jgi:hypothetical protein
MSWLEIRKIEVERKNDEIEKKMMRLRKRWCDDVERRSNNRIRK